MFTWLLPCNCPAISILKHVLSENQWLVTSVLITEKNDSQSYNNNETNPESLSRNSVIGSVSAGVLLLACQFCPTEACPSESAENHGRAFSPSSLNTPGRAEPHTCWIAGTLILSSFHTVILPHQPPVTLTKFSSNTHLPLTLLSYSPCATHCVATSHSLFIYTSFHLHRMDSDDGWTSPWTQLCTVVSWM